MIAQIGDNDRYMYVIGAYVAGIGDTSGFYVFGTDIGSDVGPVLVIN